MKQFFIKIIVVSLLLLLCRIQLFAQSTDSLSVKDQNKEKKMQETKALLEKLLQEAKSEIQQETQEQQEQEKAPQEKTTHSRDVLEIDGLIFNDTKTKIGQEFYEFYYTLWEPPDSIFDYTINISEMPAGQMGSWVLININDVTIYQNRLTPKSDEIEEAARQATAFTANYLVSYNQDQKQLAGDDMAGTGIY